MRNFAHRADGLYYLSLERLIANNACVTGQKVLCAAAKRVGSTLIREDTQVPVTMNLLVASMPFGHSLPWLVGKFRELGMIDHATYMATRQEWTSYCDAPPEVRAEGRARLVMDLIYTIHQERIEA